MDGFEKFLCTVTGIDHSSLAYLLRDAAMVPVTTESLLPGKCYSLTHKSFVEKMVARKSHSSPCVETDKVTLFELLETSLQGGPLELALQPHDGSKDGRAVI